MDYSYNIGTIFFPYLTICVKKLTV